MKPKLAVKILSALAHDTRLEVFRLLVASGAKGVTPSDLGEKLKIPATTLSFHLSQLSVAGLVETRREGRATFYVTDFGAIEGLTDFLLENCCQGQDPTCNVGKTASPRALSARNKLRKALKPAPQARRA